jgi:hypothetical protein
MHSSKKCSDCKEEKLLTEFYSKGDRFQSKCKSCHNAYCIQRWIKHKLDAIEYKGGRCFDCRQTFPYPVYEFHHLDPKQKDVAWNKLRLRSKKARQEELDKCVLLCANCHRIRHHEERAD